MLPLAPSSSRELPWLYSPVFLLRPIWHPDLRPLATKKKPRRVQRNRGSRSGG